VITIQEPSLRTRAGCGSDVEYVPPTVMKEIASGVYRSRQRLVEPSPTSITVPDCVGSCGRIHTLTVYALPALLSSGNAALD
jgi:hypothetical protein